MKQFILILLLFIGVSTMSFAQKDSTEYVTNTDTEKLIDKYADRIEAGITSLAQSLKQPAEHVYKVLVRQQVVKASTQSIIIFLFIFTGIVLIVLESKNKNCWNEDCVIGAIGVGLLLVSIIYLMFVGGSIIGGFINPEYGAIKEIINFIK